MMHILFLTDNFPPEMNAPASRTFEHCRDWVAAGHRVTILTCAPNFPNGKLFKGYRNRLFQSEMMEGIRVIRVWTFMTANEGFLLRSLDYISFMIAAILVAPFLERPDVVVGTSPQFFTGCAAYVVSRMRRAAFILEIRDLWPESIVAVGALSRGMLFRLLTRIEMFLYRKADRIICVTYSARANLLARSIPSYKIGVITNGVDLKLFTGQSRDKVLAHSLGLNRDFTIGYVGTHGLAHGLTCLLDAAKILQTDHPDIRLLMIGDGAEKPALMQRARSERLHNLQFIASVPRARIAAYWSLLDIAIVHLKPDPLFTGVIPSKIFETMAMGIPILLGVDGEARLLLEEADSGAYFPPGDARELASAVLALKDDPQRRRAYARNGKQAAPRFSRQARAAQMLREIEMAVGFSGSEIHFKDLPDQNAPETSDA